jgi:hypothetical protein
MLEKKSDARGTRKVMQVNLSDAAPLGVRGRPEDLGPIM